jgi:glutathione S-transferase
MDDVVLYGAPYSVYVRIARLTLAEKGVPYRLVEVDIFDDEAARETHLLRQPFGKIPAFEHGSFRIYETAAICRYIDETFAGPHLQPSTPRDRARMMQAISILDSYAYHTLVWDIFVERVMKPSQGAKPDEAKVAAALPMARTCLAALNDLAPDTAWLTGDSLTLADLHAAPMIEYFLRTPEGRMLGDRPRLARWWTAMAARQSMGVCQS